MVTDRRIRHVARLIVIALLFGAMLVAGSGTATAHVVCVDSVEFTTTGLGYIEQVVDHREAALQRVEFTTRGLARIEAMADGCYG